MTLSNEGGLHVLCGLRCIKGVCGAAAWHNTRIKVRHFIEYKHMAKSA